jgi:uncharacterized protein YbaR (Trm112 family)
MNESKSQIDPDLLAMLRCPKEGSKLAIADDSLIRRLNDAIRRGELRDSDDQRVDEPIEGGLITESGNRLYPIRGRIPTLIVEESIELDRLP